MNRFLAAAILISLAWAGSALGVPTAQQRCDYERIMAWKKYRSCIEAVLAKNAKGVVFDQFAAHAKCRHKYFKVWASFQNRANLAGSTCVGPRFVDNGDLTVTDNLTSLVWEKKVNLDNMANYADPHDGDSGYSWGFNGLENGTVFTEFLSALNAGSGFAGSSGWRLPSLIELETLLLDFSCRGEGAGPGCFCPADPCVEGAVDAGNTAGVPAYFSLSTSSADAPGYVWKVWFSTADITQGQKTGGGRVRAVRGGQV